jgi:hypothetical protein
MDCSKNRLTKLDVSKIGPVMLYAYDQKVPLTLYKDETEEYTHAISLNNPWFENNAISYMAGVLKSNDNTADTTSFLIDVKNHYAKLSGTMYFTYSDDARINAPEKAELKVYPNPTSGELKIEMGDMRYETCDITIHDVMGRCVWSSYGLTVLQSYGLQIDVSHLPAGMYFVKIITDTETIVKKVIKQ